MDTPTIDLVLSRFAAGDRSPPTDLETAAMVDEGARVVKGLIADVGRIAAALEKIASPTIVQHEAGPIDFHPV